MSYSPNFKKSAREYARDIRDTFMRWKDAELLSFPERIDETAEVVFEYRGQNVRVKYGRFASFRDNIAAIAQTVEDLRMVHVRGMEDLLTDTVSQMLQLGAGAMNRDPYEVLGIRPDAPLEVAEASWKALSRNAHPDKNGGDTALQTALNAAIDQIRNERKQADG